MYNLNNWPITYHILRSIKILSDFCYISILSVRFRTVGLHTPYSGWTRISLLHTKFIKPAFHRKKGIKLILVVVFCKLCVVILINAPDYWAKTYIIMFNKKSKIMRIKFLSFILLASFAAFIGCTDDNDGSAKMGKMSIQLTDAPFPHDLVAEANVTIFKIDARNMGVETEESFVVLMEQEMEVNLLDLTNGITETLVNTEVPVGTYDLVRVYVKGVNVVLTDGTSYDLDVPSGEQTGIKVFIKPGISVAGSLSADLLLDFDVSRSFVPKGNSNDLAGITGFNFKPVIKASNLSTAGSLAGMVTTLQEEVAVGMEGAQVSIFAADTLNTTTFTDETGAYMVMGLLSGNYDVTVELDGYVAQSVEDLEIAAGNKTVQDFEINAAATEQGN